jgi:hypothetical protein
VKDDDEIELELAEVIQDLTHQIRALSEKTRKLERYLAEEGFGGYDDDDED